MVRTCAACQPLYQEAGSCTIEDTLGGSATLDKQALLKKLVVWANLGKERGKVAYPFPLHECADLYTDKVPPGEYEQQDRTVLFHLSCDALDLSVHPVHEPTAWTHARSLQLGATRNIGS